MRRLFVFLLLLAVTANVEAQWKFGTRAISTTQLQQRAQAAKKRAVKKRVIKKHVRENH